MASHLDHLLSLVPGCLATGLQSLTTQTFSISSVSQDVTCPQEPQLTNGQKSVPFQWRGDITADTSSLSAQSVCVFLKKTRVSGF